MATFVFRPLGVWPGQETPSHRRQRSKFQSSWSATLDLLHRELDALHAKEVVISLALEPKDITRDNTPRSGARPRMPGVVLSFKKPGRYDPIKRASEPDVPLQFPTDTFDAWEDNVRAIALALEALRKIDRYGVTRRNEQYQGWARLPASTGDNGMTAQQAADFLTSLTTQHAANIVRGADAARKAVREAMQATHPDKGGTHDAFTRVGKAREILAAHHRVAL